LKPLQVLVTNSVMLNGGDAAIVEAIASSLQEAVGDEIDFTVLDRQPETAARLFPAFGFGPWPWDVFFRTEATTRFERFCHYVTRARAYAAAFLIGRGAHRLPQAMLRSDEWRLLRAYADADLVISKGGTYLVEIYDLTPHLFDLRLCTLLRRPLVLAPQSLGPFTNPRTQRALRKVFRHALVFVRDEKSLEHIQALHVDNSNVMVSADSAFALADQAVLAASRDRPLRRPMRVAISVREWRHFRATDGTGMERYATAVAAVVGHLVRHYGARVTFLSTCQGVPDYWTDDSRVARKIVEKLADDVAREVSVDSDYYGTEELLEELSAFDLAISTRMHFGILALAVGIPVFPIAYEFKTAELFRRLGLSAHVLDIDELSPARAVDAFDRFIRALPTERPGLFERVEEQRALAQGSAELIATFLRSRSGRASTPAGKR
jgi:colanic acid/amylovoran biosynthesis protein